MTAFRSQTDAMLAAKFDPEPWVTRTHEQRFHNEPTLAQWPSGYMFDPRPEFIPPRDALPYFYAARCSDGTWTQIECYDGGFEDGDALGLNERPEPNPILVAFREEAGLQSVADGFGLTSQAQLWLDRNEGADSATPAQIDHARKVLARLANLIERREVTR